MSQGLTGHYIDACIGKIRIWDSVLSDFDVKKLYLQFLNESPKTLGWCFIFFFVCVCVCFVRNKCNLKKKTFEN